VHEVKTANVAIHGSLGNTQLCWAIEQAPVAIALFDRQLRFCIASDRWLEYHDLKQAPPALQPYSDIFPAAPKGWVKRYRQCLELNLATSDSGYLTLPSGRSIWIRWQATPWADSMATLPEPCGLILHAERVEENAEVNLSWANAVQFSPDLYCIFSLDSRVKHVNAAWKRNLAYEPHEVYNRSFYDLIHPDDLERSEAATQQLLEGEALTQFENRYRHKDGSYRWLQWTAMAQFEREEIYAVARDITASKEANLALANSEAQLRHQTHVLEETIRNLNDTQMQLIQTEKLSTLGQLLAGVAHEINNPVNFIYGNLVHAKAYTADLIDLLESYRQEHPSPSEYLQGEMEAIDLEFLLEDLPQLISSMMNGADRIKEIVASLRNFSRLDAASTDEVDVHRCIDSTLTILQNRLKATSHYGEIQIIRKYGELPKIECFSGPLSQVFMNIINNAIDALREQDAKRSGVDREANPSLITIQTTASPQHITILIQDNGPGIPEAVRQQLFEPFFTTKPVGQGTGLGLSICNQIITEKHHGQLSCESQPGNGTTFKIIIPIHQSVSSTLLN